MSDKHNKNRTVIATFETLICHELNRIDQEERCHKYAESDKLEYSPYFEKPNHLKEINNLEDE